MESVAQEGMKLRLGTERMSDVREERSLHAPQLLQYPALCYREEESNRLLGSLPQRNGKERRFGSERNGKVRC